MGLLKYLKSLIISPLSPNILNEITISSCKEIDKECTSLKECTSPKITESKEITEPLFTMAQAARKLGVTRQAIFFAIKMKRLNAKKENDTWLITSRDLNEYLQKKYCRSKSRKEGELIFDKSKGFYSISEAAKFLNRNTNHIYYLVRMGKLRSHRQGTAIVIRDVELHNYADFINNKSERKLNIV